jgi:hypothetical protein
MRRMLGVVAIGLLALVLGGAADAGADCSGPSIRVNPTGGPGGVTVTVTGQAFGNNCYDTGPPPPGEGVLGVPQRGVVLTFTDAAGRTTELTTVDAGQQYGFVTQVTIPDGAAPGVGRLDSVSPSGNPSAPGVPFEVTGGVIPATPSSTG